MIQIQYATESDTPILAEINILCFKDGPFYHNAYPDMDTRVAIPMKHARALNKLSNPNIHILVARTSTTSSEILGCARWLIPSATRTAPLSDEGQAKAAQVERLRPSGMNVVIYEAALRMLEEKRGEHVKRDDIVLELLATYPQHQGKGVGSALLKWGIQKADELNVRIYLEATDEGYPLYCKYGFREIDEIVVDYSLYGGEGRQRYAVMIRESYEVGDL